MYIEVEVEGAEAAYKEEADNEEAAVDDEEDAGSIRSTTSTNSGINIGRR